jgi:hypothetical protein
MVVIRKPNGSSRRIVHMQNLKNSSLRHTHFFMYPYHKAMIVPRNTYKMVTDASEGYHSVPLDKESFKLTQFVTPFGC